MIGSDALLSAGDELRTLCSNDFEPSAQPDASCACWALEVSSASVSHRSTLRDPSRHHRRRDRRPRHLRSSANRVRKDPRIRNPHRSHHRPSAPPKGLALAPTRELADQITTELTSFAGNVRIGVVYGGVGYSNQIEQLRRGVDILVACPGRLEDLIDRGALVLSEVDEVVIDEADRMADMGFLPAVRRILDQTSRRRQTVLFSATLDGEVAKLTHHYQTDPVTHEVGDPTPHLRGAAEHRFLAVERADRVDTSVRVIIEAGQAIVFCRTRHGSDRVARQLTKRGVTVVAIHGGHGQNRRTGALTRFSNGDVQALVATDVAARGIHVDDVALVVHYDPPADHTTYVHRSGRTARAGRTDLVVSLVQPDNPIR